MAALRKFTFDRVFDAPVAPIVEATAPENPVAAPETTPETPAAPTFSEEELAAAREEAYAQGRETGIKEMSESIERETRDVLAGVENALRELMWSQSSIETRATEDSVRVALTAIRRLFPSLAQRDPLSEIENVVGQAMAMVQGEAILNIYVHDRLAESISARIQALAATAGFENRIKIHALASIASGDVRVEWNTGGMTRNMAAIKKTVENILARTLPEHAIPAHAAKTGGEPATTVPDPSAAPSPSENSEGQHG
jgi:flagellar assembly protein FliH